MGGGCGWVIEYVLERVLVVVAEVGGGSRNGEVYYVWVAWVVREGGETSS